MGDGATGFDDGSAQAATDVTQANRLPMNTKSTRPHIDHTDHGASSAWWDVVWTRHTGDRMLRSHFVLQVLSLEGIRDPLTHGTPLPNRPELVICERRLKMTWSMLVPRRGTEFHRITKIAAKFIDQLAHNRVTLRCDDEPAIEALSREIAQARQDGSQTVPEGESQSNGIIERAVGLVAGQAGTLKAALEYRIGTRVTPDARILCWLVECAAYLTNRCDIGSDGKTPLHRLHGRKDITPILEFGEKKILYVPAKPARGGKWEPRFHPGVFVGVLNPSSEAVGGCHRARDGDQDTRSECQENSCVGEAGFGPNTGNASWSVVSRWQRQRIRHSSQNGEARGYGASLPGKVLMGNKLARTFLRRSDFERRGPSEGCAGCWCLRTGRGDSKLTAKYVGGELRANWKATRLGPHDWLPLTRESIVHCLMQLNGTRPRI